MGQANTKNHERLESDLAQRAMSGDAEAFSAIVQRYGSAVYNHCARHVGADGAEDCSQETFIRAFVHRQRYDAHRPILPWLLTIARHVCIDTLRRTRRPATEFDERRIGREAGIEERVNAREEIVLAAEVYEKLPEGQRNALALFHFEGLSYQETADTLEVPLGTVMTWLHRGRARIKKVVERGRNQTSALGEEKGRTP